MPRYDFTSLRRAADEIERTALVRPVSVGDNVAPDELAAYDSLSGADDISGAFIATYNTLQHRGLDAYHTLDRELLTTAKGLRTMAKTAEDSDNKNAEDIFRHFAKYGDSGGGTDIIDAAPSGTKLDI